MIIFRQGNLSCDRFLMVYDLRMMRAVSPIQTVVDPLYLRFLPGISSRLAVVSRLGQVQLADTVALSEPRLCLLQMENPANYGKLPVLIVTHKITYIEPDLGTRIISKNAVKLFLGAMCLAFDVSSTNQALAFGDSAGSIHSFATSNEPIFNTFSRMTEHADHPATVPGFAVDDYETPLSIIPLPLDHSGMPPASDWPEHLMQKCYR